MTYKKTITVAKGYRLKPQTHRLIKKIQKLLKGSQEQIISEALKAYSLILKNGNNKNINNFKEEVSK